jgi:hypothetical protein
MNKIKTLPARSLIRSRGPFAPKIQSQPMSHFTINSHVVRTQHTRDRPAGAERGRDNDLRLHVKQYVPKGNPNPKTGDVTIIGAHANGFPKELYEPFWDDLYEKLQAQGRRIRGIWIADIASQGQSGIINEVILGPDGRISLCFSRSPELMDGRMDGMTIIANNIIEIKQRAGGITAVTSYTSSTNSKTTCHIPSLESGTAWEHLS